MNTAKAISDGVNAVAGDDAAASIPGVAGTTRYELSSDLVTLSTARAAEAEAIRTVRTHVVARHLEDGRRGVAVCGPTAGVGCSFTAANLAVSLSQVGVGTLLIDGDLRAPQLDRLIRPDPPAQGLRQYLATEGRPPSDFIHADVLPNLSVMFAGGADPNAQELLGGEGFKRLIESCLRDYEFTIIDTPPANRGADALRISAIIGYALVVARTNVTMISEVASLADSLQEDGARVVGAVLNEA